MYAIIWMHDDGLAPFGERVSADAIMTKFGFRIYTLPAHEEPPRTSDGTWDIFPVWAQKTLTLSIARGPIKKHGLTLIPSWISNHVPSKMWDETTYLFPNLNE